MDLLFAKTVLADSTPIVNPDVAAVMMLWGYIGELMFNMLVYDTTIFSYIENEGGA